MNNLKRPILVLTGVSSQKNGVRILDDIDLVIREGEVSVIVGPSGAGKTSLIRLMNLLDRPSNGQIMFDDVAIYLSPLATVSENLLWLRQNIGMVFQDFALWPHMSILQNLIEAPVSLNKMSKKEAIVRAQELGATFGLEDRLDAYPMMLSGGQQQRVAIMRALMMKPKVLLLDEATSALDPHRTHELGTLLRLLGEQGLAVVVVTHDMEFARAFSERLIFLEQGRVVFSGSTTDAFRAEQTIQRLEQFVNRGAV